MQRSREGLQRRREGLQRSREGLQRRGEFINFANMAQVTVIIPAYNAERWLGEALESVAMQTLSSWEAIVVDDGSQDSTAEIARAFAAKHPGQVTVASRPNRGVSAARNAGLEMARGKYVCFLDSDDALHRRALELMLRAAEQTGAEIVVTRQIYACSPAELGEPNEEAKPAIMSGLEAVEASLYRRRLEATMNGHLIERRLFTPSNLFRPGRYEDLDLGYRLYEDCSRIALMPQPLYFYRRHDESFIRQFSAERLHVLRVVEEIRRYYAGTALSKAADDRALSAYFNILGLLSREPRGKYAEAEEECRRGIRRLRAGCFFNPRGRLLNKIAILLTLPSTRLMRPLSRIYYRK